MLQSGSIDRLALVQKQASHYLLSLQSTVCLTENLRKEKKMVVFLLGVILRHHLLVHSK